MEKKAKNINLKYILPLALLFMTIYLAADSVAYKMVILGSALEPGPPFIFPLTYAISDIDPGFSAILRISDYRHNKPALTGILA